MDEPLICTCNHYVPIPINLFATRMCGMCLRPRLSDLSHPKRKMEKS